MSREIYTYTDLSRLKESSFYSELRKHPIISVSSDLRKCLNGSRLHEDVDGILKDDPLVMVTEFRSLAEAVNGDWNTDQSKFNELVVLSEFLRGKLETASEKSEINWLTGCMRNLNSLLSAILLMEQAAMKPDDLDGGHDRNILLLIDAWKYLIAHDPVLRNYNTRMAALDTRQKWGSVLRQSFKVQHAFENSEALIFHGFYYITPFQERIMSLLETAGYRLIYLIPYDERYPFVHEIWDITYSEDFGFPPKKDWHLEYTEEEDPYGEIFEGKTGVTVPNSIRIREYASVMEFVDEIRFIRKDGYMVFSADFKNANKIMRDYFPEEYGERKILSYPVGQFVSTLNQMWDDEKQSIILEEDRLIECFSSGWLSYNGISGKQYMQDLMYILPFFGGCRTISEWEKRIDLLKKISDEVISPFISEKDAVESVSRWQEAIENPFANFSMFSVPKEKLDTILQLIRQLLSMATELFGKEKNICVNDHIRKLDSILKRYEISNDMYDEERKLIADIFEKLGGPDSIHMQCSPSDISRALNLFISGKFDDNEIQEKHIGLVSPLYFADAAAIKNQGKVHVCMCDVNSTPGGGKAYIWPLTGDLIENSLDRTGNRLIRNMIHIMEATALYNRYFMYCALKCKDVTVSWVSNVNDKLLAPSPYIRLVCDATGLSIEPAKRNSITFRRVTDSAYGSGRIDEYKRSNSPSGMIKEAKMAYAFCPTRYVLGYVTEKYPTYQSEFQQTYAINALISAVSDLMKKSGMTVDQVYNKVIELFPNMRKVEKRQVYDYISYDRRENDFDYRNRTECGGSYYTDERLKVHHPNQQVRELMLGRFGKLYTPDGRKDMNLYEVVEASSEEEMLGRKDIARNACVFCPHIDHCRNAVYAVDQESYYE